MKRTKLNPNRALERYAGIVDGHNIPSVVELLQDCSGLRVRTLTLTSFDIFRGVVSAGTHLRTEFNRTNRRR
jgi:hypothetical protein